MASSVKRKADQWMATHHDVIAHHRARGLGLTDAQIRAAIERGEWVRRHPRVYVRAASRPTPQQALYAAVVWGGPGSAASCVSAAWLWGLLETAPGRPTVTLAPGTHRRGAGVRFVRSLGRGVPAPRPLVQGIPCTGLPQTLLDCALELTPRQLRPALDRAVAGHRDLTARLCAELEPRGTLFGRRGSARLAAALAAGGYTGSPSSSVLESHMARLLDLAGIDEVVREHEVVTADGQVFRLDFALPDVWLAWEVDGFGFHSSPGQVEADGRRRRALAEAGWTVLVFTWREVVHHPDEVVAELRRMAAARRPA